MEDVIEIYDLRYLRDLGNGGIVWRYHGNAPDHPLAIQRNDPAISPSIPVSLDEDHLILKTISGRLYKIMSFAGNRQEIIDQIKVDITVGHFGKVSL